jgi:hypothetical protein
MKEGYSFRFEPSVLDCLSDKLFGVVDDILSVLIKDMSADFIQATYVPMNGAQHSFVTFQADPVMFDIQLPAALRASGLNASDRGNVITHVSSPSAETSAPSV